MTQNRAGNYGGRADVNTVDDGVNDTTHLSPGLESRFELNLLDFTLSFDCVSHRASGIAVALTMTHATELTLRVRRDWSIPWRGVDWGMELMLFESHALLRN